MKQTDFDRLKAICEKEGFELLNESASDNEKFFVVKKAKDIWEGVEFFSTSKGEVFKVNFIYQDQVESNINEGFGNRTFLKSHIKPSTEQAYIEQLKAEAFKRFGEIKEGDRFDRSLISSEECASNPVTIQKVRKGFNYSKYNDSLRFGGRIIYQKGKWATRIKERVKVEIGFSFYSDKNEHIMVRPTFKVFGINKIIIEDVEKFLASKLEEYLNKESE